MGSTKPALRRRPPAADRALTLGSCDDLEQFLNLLALLFGVAVALASAYAVLAHAAQLVLYTAVGFLCLVLQGSTVGALRSDVSAHGATPLPPGP